MATFEERLEALETIVGRLEQGDLTLEDSVSLFENGVKLSNACKKELEAAEGRIQTVLYPERQTVTVADLVLDEEDDLSVEGTG